MKKVKINFIITCFDKEAYWPYLKSILNGYRGIEPNICLVYNGNDENFECDVRIKNRGHQLGEYDLIKAGHAFHKEKNPDVKFYIKLAVDSWLLNEEVILDIYDLMINRYKVPYGGNYWNTKTQLSTDIFFLNTIDVDILDLFKIEDQHNETKALSEGRINVESLLHRAVAAVGGNFYLIRAREPVHPNNREICPRLCWTMSHDLNENIRYLNYFNEFYPLRQINHCYEVLCAKESDLNKYFPKIKECASECETVCELNSRGVSSWAILAGRPKKLAIHPADITGDLEAISLAAKSVGIEVIIVNDPEEMLEKDQDMLYIDIFNDENSLKRILEKAKPKIKKYIVIHNLLIKELDGWGLEMYDLGDKGLSVFKKK